MSFKQVWQPHALVRRISIFGGGKHHRPVRAHRFGVHGLDGVGVAVRHFHRSLSDNHQVSKWGGRPLSCCRPRLGTVRLRCRPNDDTIDLRFVLATPSFWSGPVSHLQKTAPPIPVLGGVKVGSLEYSSHSYYLHMSVCCRG